MAREPDNMAFRLDYQSRRESAVESLVAAGDTARNAGQLEAASALYRRTLSIDPSNDRAHHGLDGIEADKRHALALEAARKGSSAGTSTTPKRCCTRCSPRMRVTCRRSGSPRPSTGARAA